MMENNTIALKEALCAQQQLLQKLYNELDVERESSATATSEALAMILRLQGEKAAVKMEAEQYKRLVEEKMYHAEESMQVFEDLIYQKETEIASLNDQVQGYRYKLSRFGIDDLGISEIKFPESLSRRKSAPPKLLKLKRARSISPDSDIVTRLTDERNLNLEKQTDGSSSSGINSYWDQIQKLDKIVEEVAGDQYVKLRARSSSLEVDDDLLSDSCSLSVHDVFEVPEADEIVVKLHENWAKDNGKSVMEGEKLAGKLPTFESSSKCETGFDEKTLRLKNEEKHLFFPKDGIIIDCKMAVDRAAAGFADGEGSSQETNTGREIINEGREEELRLLYEIREKLDSIQSDIRSGNTKTEKLSPDYELPMLQLTEAMLHFWI